MTTTLYDISVASYLQSLGAVAGVLEKGRVFCEEQNIDTGEIVGTCLFPDMLSFQFQVISVAHHSLGTMKGLASGKFGPPEGVAEYDYEGLQGLISETLDELKKYTPEVVNALSDSDVTFQLGEMKMPFTAANFVLSFSHPNLYFHAATTYDILRMKGVPIGKADFMGRPRLKK